MKHALAVAAGLVVGLAATLVSQQAPAPSQSVSASGPDPILYTETRPTPSTFRDPGTSYAPTYVICADAVVKKLNLLWLAVGSKDGLMRINQGVQNYMQEKGVRHIWRLDDNAHDTAEMSSNLYHFVQRLFKE